jgi:hypothetical protein
MAGLAAARGVYSDPAYADAIRLASLNAATTLARTAYVTNGLNGEPCSAGGVLEATERGHAYNDVGVGGNCFWSTMSYGNSIQQTASGIWIQLAGGADLNDASVQGYLRWIRNRYRYSSIGYTEDAGWGGSYFYYMWSKEKALSFLDESAVLPAPGNLSSADLGTLPPGDAPGYYNRQMHRDPSTDTRPPTRGAGGAGYYGGETERWYYDGAYTIMTLQDGSGFFNSPPGEWYWETYSQQAYAILYLLRSVGGGCVDTDEDGICDSEDNCPNEPNPGDPQPNADGDDQGDACDACPNDADNDADDDGVCGDVDNCPDAGNAGQADADGDGLGDACDACGNDAANDADGDGVCGNVDNCPTDANADQTDTDGDGIGDACDVACTDTDGDGVCDDDDNCPAVPNGDQADADGDGIGDACDAPEPPALPTDKDQCKKGGWMDFGIFANQGDCVSFVATQGGNPPGIGGGGGGGGKKK